ncbi:MAG: hypothetical protein LBU46_08515 [Candidatus Accumulibacter sp.]|nr:hypothetical protein [Accumulibacter sp.]
MNHPQARDEAAEKGEGVVARLMTSQKRQARNFVSDVLCMRGLMPLLMKRRNGGHWTVEEKAELLRQLRAFSRISPTLLFLLLPGSMLLLPMYALWLDRRRRGRLVRRP